jgi:hypothetical protein
MRTFLVAATLASTLAIPAQDTGEGRDGPKQALAQFLAEHGDQWIVQWHPATGTPSAIFGRGLPIADWAENSLDEARRQALRVLDRHADLLGRDDSDFREIIGARMGRTWSFTFDQYYRDLQVIEGRADVRINMNGTVAMFGSRAFRIPAGFDTTPKIDEDVAVAIAWNAMREVPNELKQPVRTRAPRLVIWGDVASPTLAQVNLAWEVHVSNIDQNGDGRIGLWYVDAKTGGVLQYVNDKHECGSATCTHVAHELPVAAAPLPVPVATTVTVMAWTRTGNDAWSALVNTPLRGIEFNVPGIGLRTTDSLGQFVIDIASPVTIGVNGLDGTRHSLISGSSTPTGSFQVNPGVNATIQLLTQTATVDQAAHTTTAYWVDRVNEWARSILGNTSQLNTADNVQPTVNFASTCNAVYSGNTITFYLAGSGCANTAFSTVIAHEWGHGLDDRYGGISNSTGDGLSEGWGDIIGMYLVDSNLLGSGFNSPGSPLRNGVNSRTYPQTGQPVHVAGQVWMGFAWELRTRLRSVFGTPTAISISNDIVISSIVADATNQVDAVREVFIADDDDGNLLNGTPHYDQLSGAAIAKGLPYPQKVWATILHTPLASTDERVTPREVRATVIPTVGTTITNIRLHYNAGAGNLVRNMHPQGGLLTWRALLPGRESGPVSYHIEAQASTGGIQRLPESGEYEYSVDAAAASPFVGFWSEGFEGSTAAWTSVQVLQQNDWQVGDPAGKSGTSGGVSWSDPQLAASGTNCIGNDLGNTIGGTTWNGRYQTNVENYLRSPVINCTGRVGVRLRFKRWLTVEAGQYDQATLSVNGQVVWQNPFATHLQDTSWQTVEYLLPMADNNPSVQIEWRLKADGGVELGGWNIDDVELGTRAQLPLAAKLEWIPEQAPQGTSSLIRVTTAAPGLPYVLAVSSAPGPLDTGLPGIPPMSIGGAIITFGGSTDATGAAYYLFPAPDVPDAIGLLYYSQVLTTNAAISQWVVSNPFLSLVTLTP